MTTCTLSASSLDRAAARRVPPERSLAREDLDDLLRWARFLPRAQRVLIEQIYGHGLRPSEVAATMNVSTRTVQRRAQLIRKRLLDHEFRIAVRERWARSAAIAARAAGSTGASISTDGGVDALGEDTDADADALLSEAPPGASAAAASDPFAAMFDRPSSPAVELRKPDPVGCVIIDGCHLREAARRTGLSLHQVRAAVQAFRRRARAQVQTQVQTQTQSQTQAQTKAHAPSEAGASAPKRRSALGPTPSRGAGRPPLD